MINILRRLIAVLVFIPLNVIQVLLFMITLCIGAPIWYILTGKVLYGRDETGMVGGPDFERPARWCRIIAGG